MPDWVPGKLASGGVQMTTRFCSSPEEVVQHAKEAEVIWVFGGGGVVTEGILGQLPSCRVILRTGTGTDNIPVAAATNRGIMVANTPLATSHAVAEHAIGLLFSVTRQIAAQDRLVRQGVWDRDRAWPQWHMKGSTLGLLGFGRIGQLVARKASGLEMRIITADPIADTKALHALQVELVSVDDLFRRSDFLSIHAPLLPTTKGIVGDRELRLMKPNGVIINTSRGGVIDEQALIRALREGRIAAAGLDVFETEPIPPDHPYLSMDQVVLTPHIAGYFDAFWHDFWDHSTQTLIEYAATKKPLWIVNPVPTKCAV